MPGGVVQLDTAPVAATNAAPRMLRDARSVIGEWRKVGSDSVMLTLTTPERRTWRGAVVVGRLILRAVDSDTAAVTLIQVACPGS
jgi:hypothetical protein